MLNLVVHKVTTGLYGVKLVSGYQESGSQFDF
jgi:hypothetical protein